MGDFFGDDLFSWKRCLLGIQGSNPARRVGVLINISTQLCTVVQSCVLGTLFVVRSALASCGGGGDPPEVSECGLAVDARAVGERLQETAVFDVLLLFEIGDGAREFDDSMISARRQFEFLGGVI